MTVVCKAILKVKINGDKYEIADPKPNGRQLLRLAAKRPVEEHVIFMFLKTGLMKQIGLDDLVDLRQEGVEKFITFETDRIFRFILDGRDFEWGANLITGLMLKKIAQVSPDKYCVYLDLRGDGKDQKIKNDQVVNLSEDGLERFFTRKSNSKFVTIYVEGLPHEWPKNKKICHMDVILLEESNYDPNTTYAIKYKKGVGSKPEGILPIEACIKVKEGMVFSVSETGQS